MLLCRQLFQELVIADILTDPTYLAGHAAAIFLSLAGKPTRIGTFGILHPHVLQKFTLPFPTSVLEMNIEVFM